jgi:hypothetical protein
LPKNQKQGELARFLEASTLLEILDPQRFTRGIDADRQHPVDLGDCGFEVAELAFGLGRRRLNKVIVLQEVGGGLRFASCLRSNVFRCVLSVRSKAAIDENSRC